MCVDVTKTQNGVSDCNKILLLTLTHTTTHYRQKQQKCVQNSLVVFALLGVMGSNAHDEPIAVRKFSLVTKNGENVLHKDFDRRRLTDGLDHLSLAFRAANHDVSQASIFAMLGFL